MYHFKGHYDQSHFEDFRANPADSRAEGRNSTLPALTPFPGNNFGASLSRPGTGTQSFSPNAIALTQFRDAPISKYHIPGYQGFVRGLQFRHGETFGKSTRRTLDVPVDVPLEP